MKVQIGTVTFEAEKIKLHYIGFGAYIIGLDEYSGEFQLTLKEAEKIKEQIIAQEELREEK